MAQKAAQTGPGPTVMVALEQRFPDSARIVNDELAYRILPFAVRGGIWLKLRFISIDKMVRWSEKNMPGMWSGFMCRKRYIDDKVAEAVDSQTEVVVNLGAGFDTRAYRLSALSSVPVWEVDQPANIDAKRSRLKKVFENLPTHVTLVPIDFDHEILGDVMASHGYVANMNTFFIWEAVTQYLDESSIRKTFDFLARSPSASRLVFTYIRKDFIDGVALYGHDFLYKKMILKDKCWLFGMDPQEVTDFLCGYGWRVIEHLGYEELVERYVKPTGRQLLSTALERVVYAEKM